MTENAFWKCFFFLSFIIYLLLLPTVVPISVFPLPCFHGYLEGGNTKWTHPGDVDVSKSIQVRLQQLWTNPPSCPDISLHNQLYNDKLRHIICYSSVLNSNFRKILWMNAYQAAVKMIPFSRILPYTHYQTSVFLITVIVWNFFFLSFYIIAPTCHPAPTLLSSSLLLLCPIFWIFKHFLVLQQSSGLKSHCSIIHVPSCRRLSEPVDLQCSGNPQKWDRWFGSSRVSVKWQREWQEFPFRIALGWVDRTLTGSPVTPWIKDLLLFVSESPLRAALCYLPMHIHDSAT